MSLVILIINIILKSYENTHTDVKVITIATEKTFCAIECTQATYCLIFPDVAKGGILWQNAAIVIRQRKRGF